MLDYRSMTDDELYFPQLFANRERQARFLADTEPPIDPDGDTAKLELPPAPLYDLADDDDWPAIDDSEALLERCCEVCGLPFSMCNCPPLLFEV